MAEAATFGVELEQQEGFEFRVRFDWPGVEELTVDEPEPLGKRRGPNAARLVPAAVANCLAASLVSCLRSKFRQSPGPVRAMASGRPEREDFCVVTQSIRAGIPVRVSVADAEGKVADAVS